VISSWTGPSEPVPEEPDVDPDDEDDLDPDRNPYDSGSAAWAPYAFR
jgi:hypothetical protein